jgi:dethiobiotin synthase
VTGTDTGVGKTVVSAALFHRYRTQVPLRYWKPIQTGTEHDDDTAEIRRLTTIAGGDILDDGIRLPHPVSPHLAASLAGQAIDLPTLTRMVERYPPTDRWIVEGAGGVLVPLNQSELMVDLIGQLGLPVLIVSRSALGTINHTLLTLEGLRSRSLVVAGVVMVGEANAHNRDAVERYGHVPVIAEMPCFADLSDGTLAQWAAAELDRDEQLAEWLQ